MSDVDTIYALSTAPGRAGIAVVRLSGPEAAAALGALAGRVPPPRRASLARFRDADGETIDEGIALYFPAPASVTGEDVAELHLHGSRAVLLPRSRPWRVLACALPRPASSRAAGS